MGLDRLGDLDGLRIDDLSTMRPLCGERLLAPTPVLN